MLQGSKGGLRLGNLCMVSDCPRPFSPQECVLLVNFAGLQVLHALSAKYRFNTCPHLTLAGRRACGEGAGEISRPGAPSARTRHTILLQAPPRLFRPPGGLVCGCRLFTMVHTALQPSVYTGAQTLPYLASHNVPAQPRHEFNALFTTLSRLRVRFDTAGSAFADDGDVL